MNLDKISLTFYASVSGDGMRIHNRKVFDKDLLMFDGKEIEIIIRKKCKRRSLPQNNFYHGVIIPIVRDALREAGIIMSHEQTHELLKFKCNPVTFVNKKTGEILTAPGSTKILTTSGMLDYTTNIKVWSREYLNIEIPDPGEVMEIEFNDITV